MARRKQQNPKHLETSQELATSLQNGICHSSDSEEDEHVCGKCRAEFPSLSDFLKHKLFCVSKRPVLVYPDSSKENYSKDTETALSDDDPPTLTAVDSVISNGESKNFNLSDLPQLVQQISDSSVTLEELRNTRVAVSQQGRMLHESQLAALLSNIHQQQVAQLHVIQELQAQILGSPASPRSLPLVGTAALTPPQSGSEGAVGVATPNSNQPSAPIAARTYANNLELNAPAPVNQNGSAYEPNTLELLQRHTEKALQKTMSSGTFLLSNMGLKRVSEDKTEDSTVRHKCRFCGKIFGSDSSLQIHIRSHTGERPFKCSVCGSCFSTKGNLKVHFQRHKDRMEVPSDLQNGDFSNPLPSNCEDISSVNQSEDLEQTEKALDFSASADDKSPQPNAEQSSYQSRSVTPNEMSALSEDSADISVDGADEHEGNVRNEQQDYEDEDEDKGSNLSLVTDNNADGDSDTQRGSQPSPYTSPSFSSFFRPNAFGSTLSDIPMCLPPRTSTVSSIAETVALHQDPSLYQDLLPRIGSNDNSWESLMEVTETSETTKLQKLVDNIEVSDPNQCIICHRVLSCKSALQMHYRTHTGERPFKCKICGRAFTTKGNLKTHMGVHRHKPPTRILHQCPVCHKQFANAVILQQHIRMHTAVTNTPLPDPLFFGDAKNSTLLPPSYPRQMLLPQHLANPEPLALTNSEMKIHAETSLPVRATDSVIKAARPESAPQQQQSGAPSPTASTSSGDIPTTTTKAENYSSPEGTKPLSLEPAKSPEERPKRPVSVESVSPGNVASGEKAASPERKPYVQTNSGECVGNKEGFTAKTEPDSEKESGVEPLTSNASPNPAAQELPMSKAEGVREQHSMVLNLPNDKPLPMTLPSDCPIPLSLQSERQLLSASSSSSQTEYTASLTALENHVKAINSSTTNPLPFPAPYGLGFSMPYYRQEYGYGGFTSKEKCRSYSPLNSKAASDSSVDERSTPVSQSKQESLKTAPPRSESGALDLTPRGSSAPSIQRTAADLKVFTPLAGLPFPPHTRAGTTCQICFKVFACQSALEIHYRSHTKERPFKCEVCDRGFSTKGNMKQHMLTHKIRDLPPQLFTSNSPATSGTTAPASTTAPGTEPRKVDEHGRRSVSETGHAPRRSGIPKHVCEVCRKPFSSGSALQIHMRTHTGVKPFQCNICSRAFTTKGNLKVHMGTHLSNNGTSRRGRRMSLDISPLTLPLGKPGEYRPDLFFPYLPPFMKGVAPQPPPKMNEISVIQSAGNRDDNVVSLASAMNSSQASSYMSSRPMAMQQPASSPLQQQTKPEEKFQDDESGLRSPGRARDGYSPSGASVPDVAVAERNASWGWKIACNRCNKICSSSAELELHISTEHMKAEPPENLSASSQNTT